MNRSEPPGSLRRRIEEAMGWALALLLVIAAAALVLAVRRQRRAEARRRFARLCEAAGIHCTGLRACGLHEETLYFLRHDPRSAGGGLLCVAIGCPSPFEFRSRRREPESPSGITTGDIDLDRLASLSGPSAEEIGEYFSHVDARRALRKLHELGCSEVRLAAGTLEARWESFSFGAENDDARLVTAAAAYLCDLGRLAPARRRRRLPLRPRTRRLLGTRMPLGALVAAAGAALWAALAFPVVDWRAVLAASFVLSGPLYAVVAVCGAALLLRGSPAQSELGRFLLLCAGALPLAVLAALLAGNGRGDATAPAVYSATVEEKLLPSVPGLKLPLRVRSWRKGTGSEIVWAAHDVYERIEPNTRVVVVTHPGRLGFEWIENVSLLALPRRPTTSGRTAQALS